MKSTSSPDDQSLFSMTEDDCDGNELRLSHASSASFVKNSSRHGNGSSADRLVQNAILGKNVRVFFDMT